MPNMFDFADGGMNCVSMGRFLSLPCSTSISVSTEKLGKFRNRDYLVLILR